MSGASAVNQYGVYGTKGKPAQTNLPGARGGAVSWTEPSGNFWLFGGGGYAANVNGGLLNDLWKWDGTNWTWVSGSNAVNQYGVYGIKGTPDPANIPGARYSAISWIDAAGNLWLFGGDGYGCLNDLWKWDGTNWTWVSGSNGTNQYGVYGIKGTPDLANVPGGRYAAVSWKDASGNLWLFGGLGYAASGDLGFLNDLWKWDGTNWTWISGSNVTTQDGVYGIKGTPDPANVPGARGDAISWIDPSGNLWIFGGRGKDGSVYFNDLWKWDGTNWTWVSGSNGTNQDGVYGIKGTPDPANVPGARGNAISWMEPSGNLWLFGGVGKDAIALFNDLWKWDGTSWTWVSGSNETSQFGTYGTKGNPGPFCIPGARGGAVGWKDASGNLWLFGGGGYAASGSQGALNDLWKYTY